MTLCWKKSNEVIDILQRYIQKIRTNTLTENERKNMIYFVVYDFALSHPDMLENQDCERKIITGLILASMIVNEDKI